MAKDKGNSTGNRVNIEEKSSPVKVTTGWLISAIVTLAIAVAILIYDKITEHEAKDLLLWFLFMLLASAISCIFGAITSHLSQKSEENREKNMAQEICDFFTAKTDEVTGIVTDKTIEIKSEIKIALEQNKLFSGDQDNILRILMERSLGIGKIERIRILAHNSDSFSNFFTNHFKKKEKKLECKELYILVHNQNINLDSEVVNDWHSFFKNKEIESIQIKKARIDRRSFFGIIIDFEKEHHYIGLMGFYKPQDIDTRDDVHPFEKRYGVFTEGNSILDVLDEYFDHYFKTSYLLLEDNKTVGT